MKVTNSPKAAVHQQPLDKHILHDKIKRIVEFRAKQNKKI